MDKQTQYDIVSALGGLSAANPVLKSVFAILRDEEEMVAQDIGDPAHIGEPLHKIAGQLNGVLRIRARLEEYRAMTPEELEVADGD